MKRVDLKARDAANPKRCCKQCGAKLTRKRYSNQAPESEDQFNRRLFCSLKCFGDSVRGPAPETLAKIESGVKVCGRCGESKLLSEFAPKGATRRGVPRYSYCKPCHKFVQYEYTLRRFFLLTWEKYEKIAAYTDNKCAICGLGPLPGRRLSLDHRHSDGLIRGILCNMCNRSLARWRENTDRMLKAVEYLLDPPASKALGVATYGLPGRIGTKKQRKLARKHHRK